MNKVIKTDCGMNEPAYLRALEPEDVERTHKWHNSAELYHSLGSPFYYVSKHAEKAWLEQKSKFSEKEINLAICTKESSEHVGNIYLRNIDWLARIAELHLFIGEPSVRRQGLGSCAVRQLLAYAFNTLNLWKIHLRVISSNEQAISLYYKAGFIKEGELIKHVFKNGKYSNLSLMGLTREMFETG